MPTHPSLTGAEAIDQARAVGREAERDRARAADDEQSQRRERHRRESAETETLAWDLLEEHLAVKRYAPDVEVHTFWSMVELHSLADEDAELFAGTNLLLTVSQENPHAFARDAHQAFVIVRHPDGGRLPLLVNAAAPDRATRLGVWMAHTQTPWQPPWPVKLAAGIVEKEPT